MAPFALHEIFGNHFVLSHHRTIFWEEEQALIISDLHLGKIGHFRKNGIGIPQNIFKEDLQRLLSAIQLNNPKQIIVVGDFFHSNHNSEHELFLRWRNDFKTLPIKLIMGNHDILDMQWYRQAGIACFEKLHSIGNFIFCHDVLNIEMEKEKFYFSGHIHPGIKLKGMGKQSLQLPCFYFGKQLAVLPAFGRFTGTQCVRVNKSDSVYALTENNVIKVQ